MLTARPAGLLRWRWSVMGEQGTRLPVRSKGRQDPAVARSPPNPRYGLVPSRYGVTWATKVPQLARGVRGLPGMNSPANQTVPLGSATAAE